MINIYVYIIEQQVENMYLNKYNKIYIELDEK